MPEETNPAELLSLMGVIVAAYLSTNKTASSEIAPLIRNVYRALADLRVKGTLADRTMPAIPIKRSVTADYIVCLEDGRQLKMLKRHLRTSYGMTPEQYRKRWNLPADYPMVSPNHAKKRSKLAKDRWLGTRPHRGGAQSME